MTLHVQATGVSRVPPTKRWRRDQSFLPQIQVGLARNDGKNTSGWSKLLAGWVGIPEILSSDGDCYGWGRR